MADYTMEKCSHHLFLAGDVRTFASAAGNGLPPHGALVVYDAWLRAAGTHGSGTRDFAVRRAHVDCLGRGQLRFWRDLFTHTIKSVIYARVGC